MSENYSLTDLRKAASVLLAASAKKTFPDVQLLGGGSSALGFYYDFIFPFEFQSSLLVLIEEGMVRLIKKAAPFALKEMVPLCASEYLMHKGQLLRAKKLEDVEDGLVSIVEIDGIVDFIDEALICSVASDVGAVKLKVFEKVGERAGSEVIRIWGAADRDKQSLKDFLKQEKDLIQKMHTSVGFDRKYFTCLSVPGQWLWLPRGVALLDGIKNIVDSHLREEGYQRVAIPSIQQLCWQMAEDIEPFDEGVLDKRAEMACASGLSKVCEELAIFDPSLDDFSCGLLRNYQSLFDVEYNFCDEKQLFDQCISSLQFIIKMLKILGFEFKIIFSARKVKASSLHREEKASVSAVRQALDVLNISAQEKTHATFKGALLEFYVQDALKREWKLSFMRVSFLEKSKPMVITSTLGSRERCAALLIEHGNEDKLLR